MNISDNIGVKYGAIVGLLTIIVYSVLYAISTQYMFNQWLGFATFITYIVTMVLAARHTKRDLGGYATFTQLVAPAFAVIVVAQLLGSMYNYVMYNFIDPTLTETLRNFTSEVTYNWMSSFGTPEEEIERALDEIENQDFSVTLSSTLWGFTATALFAFFVAAIIALILRKNPPAGYHDNPAQEQTTQDVAILPKYNNALPQVNEDPVYPETVLTNEPDTDEELPDEEEGEAPQTNRPPGHPDFPQ